LHRRVRNHRFLTSRLVQEDGFDDEGNFIYIPFSDLKKMTEYFRRKIISLFLKNDLINEDFARNLLSWRNSGFSIDNSVQILTDKTRINLSEYIHMFNGCNFQAELTPVAWPSSNPKDCDQASIYLLKEFSTYTCPK
jgi:hypothetical protein